jgi:hypothetical protein
MKKKDFILVVILVGLIVFLTFDLRKGGSGISSHIAGAFTALFFNASSDSKAITASPAVSAPAAEQMSPAPPSAIVAPSAEPVQGLKSMNPSALRRTESFDRERASHSLSRTNAVDSERIVTVDTAAATMPAPTSTTATTWETKSTRKH